MMFLLPNLLSFSFFCPLYRLFLEELTLFVLIRICLFVHFVLSSLLCPLLQVLKPLSEHYMEDNVRQTVVNSLKASLTEQGSQHTKLKTH